MYRKNVDNLRDEVARDLRFSASSYYIIGIGAFHESRMKGWVDFQPAIGNLAISVELILKALVAQMALRMLYSNLPDEAQLLLCYPESLTIEHNSISYLNDMKNFSFKAIELDKAVSLFYYFHPELKPEFKQFFTALSTVRNVSVHASVPGFQRYELDRIAYFSTRLFSKLSELGVFKYFTFKIEEKTESFLKYYEDEKVKKVKSALDKARELVKKGKLSEPSYNSEDWETMDVKCPICDNPASYSGETECTSDLDGIQLTFECGSFSCDACGLVLEDYEELKLAGMETSLDRENDVDKWASENEFYDYDDRW